MIRRHFLNFVFGVAAGIAAFAATANAAPLPPISAAQSLVLPRAGAEPAVVAQDEVNRLQPEQVRWHHHHHWHHRHWHHWHHHHWHHRHWHHWHHGITTTGTTGIITTGIIATTGITTTSNLILVLPRTQIIFVSLSLRRSEPAGLGQRRGRI